MKKHRIAAAFIIAALTVSGCAGNAQSQPAPPAEASESAAVRVPADAKEYLEALKETFHEYANSSFSFPDDLESLKFDEAKKDLDNMEAALKAIENIAAPEQYTDLQDKLIGSVATEREYLENCRAFIGYCEMGDSITEDDVNEVQKLNEALDNAPADFAETYLEVVKAVKADIDQ